MFNNYLIKNNSIKCFFLFFLTNLGIQNFEKKFCKYFLFESFSCKIGTIEIKKKNYFFLFLYSFFSQIETYRNLRIEICRFYRFILGAFLREISVKITKFSSKFYKHNFFGVPIDSESFAKSI